jgi:1-deoxy-D-xylulose-5-phosphate synthase
MRFVKPLDEAAISEAARDHDLLVTIEENAIAGGAGSAVNEWLATSHKPVNILNLGFPDTYVGQGTQAEMLAEWGLDANGILQCINQRLAEIDASNCQ